MNEQNETLKWVHTHIDLLSEKYGGQALSCNDEFFAEASNLVKRSTPVFIVDKYTDRGKWMDGWETRRRRTQGHDWCILRLGVVGTIKAFDVDTTFFKGNAPGHVKIEGCLQASDPTETTSWQTVLDTAKVQADSHNYYELEDSRSWSHLRLNIYPDGGVARLRVYGEPRVDWSALLPNELVDLASCSNGGRAVACSDMFFSPMNNVLAPGRGINMGDGWETRRRRDSGHDWLIIKLACPGNIGRVLIDTCHFKGNFPDSFTLEATESRREDITADDINWLPLIERSKLIAHTEHFYQDELKNKERAFTHIKLNIFPDGGISRVRIFGYPLQEKLLTLDDFNQLTPEAACEALEQCCAATRWAKNVVANRPYASLDDLIAASDKAWEQTEEQDWLLAFSAHPQIGNVETLRAKYANTKAVAAGEQSAVDQASDEVLEALASRNRQYLEQNGFIFIVFATGKSAGDMLQLLNQRLVNTREQELVNGAAEQHKITTLRIRKLFEGTGQ